MKNIVTKTLQYTGIVTLSQYIGSKKVKITQLHNSGGEPLFRFFASCLAGDFTAAKLMRPTKVMLIEPKDTSATVIEFQKPFNTAGFVYQLTKPEIVETKDGSSSRVRYSFMIAKEQIASINDFENLYMGLYTDEVTVENPDNYAAICKLAISKNNIANTSLLIDWELVISNAEAKS
jgi:hypothetical protein